jgi:hypothetical protein
MARDEIERMYGLGLISAKQLNEAQYNKPGKGNPDRNPEADFGPDDAGEIDAKKNRRGDKESKTGKAEPERKSPTDAELRRILADQWSPSWYADESWKGK